MNLFYKIFLLSLLSISFPIGKLFDIFIWNNRITKTETVFFKKRVTSRKSICSFVKIAKAIKNELIGNLQKRSDFTIIEILTNKKNILSSFIQNNKSNNYKVLFIKQFVFNKLLADETLHTN